MDSSGLLGRLLLRFDIGHDEEVQEEAEHDAHVDELEEEAVGAARRGALAAVLADLLAVHHPEVRQPRAELQDLHGGDVGPQDARPLDADAGGEEVEVHYGEREGGREGQKAR